jgi:hypothetical protein
MIGNLPSIDSSVAPAAKLWRFLDFTKYVAMLHRHAFFFARADQVPDPFEGVYARNNLGAHQWPRRDGTDSLYERVFLNCWHDNDHESAAMWRIYLHSSDGVAIRTTAERLQSALSSLSETLYLGRVRYLDYARDKVPEQHELDPFFCKRKSFDYEREVRALWLADGPHDEAGRYVPVNLGALVEEVVISPTANPWLEELVRSVTGKYGMDFPIVGSALLEDPSYDGPD